MGHEQLDESQMSQSRFEYAIADAKKAEVMVKYVPTGEYKAGQLHLNVGDVVWVLEESDGWWGGHKDGDDQTGWFPAGICQIIGRGDDDSFEDGERAFCTADGRAVASPQAKGRSQVAAAQVEVAETKAALEQEKLQVQALEEQLKGLKKEQQEWLLERHRWTRKAEECESKAKHYQNECRSKEAELAQAKDGRIAAEVKLRDEKNRSRSLEAKLNELQEHCRCLESQSQVVQQALDAAQHAAQHTLQERQGRSSDRGQIRTAPALESSGHRTPSAPHTVSTLHPSSSGGGSLQVPVGGAVGAIATSMGTVGALPLSARQPQAPLAGNRHASPRHGHASTSWMPPSASGSGGPPASPHMRQRILSQRDMALETNTQAPVRNIISEFERRSNSQGAPLSREPLPTNRQLAFTNGSSQSNSSSIRRPMVVSSACTMPASSSATIRAGSREALPLQLSSNIADPETPHASPTTRGEEPKHLNFGMSPIKRSAIPMPRGGPSMVPSMPSMSYSPPSRSASGTVSVQERVRQLQQRR